MAPPASSPEQATPEKTAGKFPKAVSKIREQLLAKGLSLEHLDAAGLYKHVEAKTLNALATGARAAQNPHVKSQYQSLDIAGRRDWLVQYLIDPVGSTCRGISKTVAENGQKNLEDRTWLTESQIGGPLYLNDTEAARLLCAASVLPERQHEIPVLANAGLKQFEFSWSKVS